MAAALAPCPLCGVAIPSDAYYCKHCGNNLPTDASGKPAFGALGASAPAIKGTHYCTQCGSVAYPKNYTKGSFGIEILLYLLMILPGILYTLWRLTSKYKGCPKCHAPNMIPVGSPIAQAALRGQGATP